MKASRSSSFCFLRLSSPRPFTRQVSCAFTRTFLFICHRQRRAGIEGQVVESALRRDSVGQKPLKLKQGLDSVSCFNTEPDSRFRFNCFESVLKHGVYSPPASSFIITSSSSSMLAS